MLVARASDSAILAAHREFYGARKAVAPPQVRNAVAVAAMCEHRPVRWRGHTYRVPPIRFRDAWRLLAVAEILTSGPKWARREALRKGRRLLGALVGTRWYAPNPFRGASAPELVAQINAVLAVPDESPAIPDSNATTVNLADGFLEFARAFPAFVDPAGLPVTWQHYQYGLRHIRRVVAREELRAAQAARSAQYVADSWKQYMGDLRRAAEVH